MHLGTGERSLTADLQNFPKYGAQRSRPHESLDQPQALLADDNWRYEAFRSRAGRRFEMRGFNFECDGPDIRTVLAGFAAEGSPAPS